MIRPKGEQRGRDRRRLTPLERLMRDPRRFRFDAAIRILLRAAKATDPSEAVRFRTPPGLTFPPSDVLEVRPKGKTLDMTVGLMGLTGPSGVMPRYYSEMVSSTLRGGSDALHVFVDMLGSRFVAFFARAGIRYRPARAAETAAADPARLDPTRPDPITQALLALTGYGTPHLAPRLACGTEPMLHYAGLFAQRPRSADRLAAILSDFLGMTVEVVEFAGAWLSLPPDQRTRIGANGAFSQLGIDAAAGMRAWDAEARILLRVGPLSRDAFHRLLPDGPALHRLVALVRAFVGMELGFAVNLILDRTEVPPLRLDCTAVPATRLGWNTWVGAPRGASRQADAGDAVFDADMIEALARRKA